MAKIICCAVAARAWQTLLGPCRAPCLLSERLWCRAGAARQALWTLWTRGKLPLWLSSCFCAQWQPGMCETRAHPPARPLPRVDYFED